MTVSLCVCESACRMRSGTERNKDTTLCSTKQETWLNGGKRRRGKRWWKRDKKRETERDSEKGQHRRPEGTVRGGLAGAGSHSREGERARERKKERDGERAPGLIYRRGVSVIISPSLSCPALGSERALSRPLTLFPPSPSLPPQPVYLHPSGYRDCGRALTSLRASVPLAPGHP